MPKVGDVQVMDRASMFLQLQFRLTPVDVGPSIQFTRQEEVMCRARSITTPQEMGILRSEDAPSDEVTPEVEIAATGGMEIDTDLQVEHAEEDGIDYGSDIERTMTYIKSLEDVLEKGWEIGHNAMSRTKKLHLVLAYI